MTDQKTHWKVFHNPDYIGAYAFQPGERKVLTVVRAVQEKVTGSSGKKEECLVVHFNEEEKPLICNVTNSKAIAKVCGSPYIEDWKGVKIELFTTEVQAFGDTVEAVRVKQTPPKARKAELHEDHPAWNKVKKAVMDGFDRSKIEQKYIVTDEVWESLQPELEVENG